MSILSSYIDDVHSQQTRVRAIFPTFHASLSYFPKSALFWMFWRLSRHGSFFNDVGLSTGRETDRWTDRQIDRQTDRQTDDSLLGTICLLSRLSVYQLFRLYACTFVCPSVSFVCVDCACLSSSSCRFFWGFVSLSSICIICIVMIISHLLLLLSRSIHPSTNVCVCVCASG